jgi:Rrf2 family iron-sulfur cluster assembly transcriptional regulator
MTLERAGLVTGTRGPSGGYRLARPAVRISLAEVYEAVEGPLGAGRCIFGVPVCDGHRCVLGGYFGKVSRDVVRKLKTTKLSEVALTLGGKHG